MQSGRLGKKMILLCDTNVFLAPVYSSHQFLMESFRDNRRFFLGLDKYSLLQNEYRQYSRHNRYIQEIVKRVTPRNERRVIRGIPVAISEDVHTRLADLYEVVDETPNRVEHALLCTALANPGVTLVCVDSRCSTLTADRVWLRPDRLEFLQEFFPEIRVKSCDELHNILHSVPEGVPRDYSQLKTFLAQDKIRWEENDWVEFKAPQRQGLIPRMCRDIAKAVCALLNTTSGYVFVGIEEDPPPAQLIGFPLIYCRDDHDPTSCREYPSDKIQIILEGAYLNRIVPSPRPHIMMWQISIPHDEAKIILVILVDKGNTIYQYDFDGSGPKAFRRVGTQSVVMPR